MPHLRNLSITGFKSIWDQSVSLGKLNVIIGTNGAGKSNFLEAIGMLSASMEGGVDYDRLARRGARLSAPDVFRSAFKNKNRKNSLRLCAETDSTCYQVSLNSVGDFSYHAESFIYKSEKLAGRSNHGATLLGEKLPRKIDPSKSIIPLLETLNHNAPTQDFIKSLKNYAIYAPSTPILRGVTPDTSARSPLGLYGGRLAEAMKEVLQSQERNELVRFFQLFDWFQKIAITNVKEHELISEHVGLTGEILKFTDSYMKRSFDDLYAYDVSEGVLYVLFVITLLLHEEGPSIFALDNVDNALNPGLIRNLMSHVAEIVAEKDKQVFMTTHNPTTLDAIDLFNEDHRLFVLERNSEGATEIKRITPPDGMTRSDWEEEFFGMPLSEIWLSGAIGGIPERLL